MFWIVFVFGFCWYKWFRFSIELVEECYVSKENYLSELGLDIRGYFGYYDNYDNRKIKRLEVWSFCGW